jgi:hypothetical protein
MPNYQISTSGCLWERMSCGTTFTLEFSTLGKKTNDKIKHAPIIIQVSKPSIYNDSITYIWKN